MNVIIAAIIAVAVLWVIFSLFQWRRVSWRDHLDAPVNLIPREARRNGNWAAWKVFANHEEVTHPSLVLLRIKNSGFTSVSTADIRRPITFTFPGRMALLAGLQAGVTFSHGGSTPSACGSGRLTLEGSTAFASAAQQIGREYMSMCHGADISVSGIATFNGLNALSSAGNQKRQTATALDLPGPPATAQIAMSDGPAPSGYPGLTGHPVAVAIFAVVVNR